LGKNNSKKIIEKVINAYNGIIKYKNTLRDEGYSDFDIFQEATKIFEKDLKGKTLKQLFGDGVELINSFTSEEAVDKIKNFRNFYDIYKQYIQSENEESLSEIVEEILNFNIISDNKLKDEIGENAYNELITIVVINCVKISKITYQYCADLLSQVEFANKVKTQFETYTMQIVEFLKDKVEIQKYAEEIFNFAFGNRAKAILGLTLKIVAKIFNKEHSDKTQFETQIVELENIEVDTQNENSQKIEDNKIEKEDLNETNQA
jgi:hypothetical protein